MSSPTQALIQSGDLDCIKEVKLALEPDDLMAAFLHPTSLGGNSFMEVAYAGNAEIVEFLYHVAVDVLELEEEQFLDTLDVYEDNAFNYAAQEGHLDALIFLHSVGANFRQVSDFISVTP